MKNLTEKFKALCDENRLKIVRMLAHRELCVCDILENFHLSQPTVSHHLKVLVNSGLIQCEKRGRWCFYSVNYDAIEELVTGINELVREKWQDVKLCDCNCDGNRK